MHLLHIAFSRLFSSLLFSSSIENNFCYDPDFHMFFLSLSLRGLFAVPSGQLACLNEESYPVLASYASSVSTLKTVEQHSQDKSFRNSQHTSSSMATVSDSEANLSTQPTETNLENPLQHTYSTVLDAPTFTTKENEFPAEQRENDAGFERCVADDSESGDDDLYLSECKILLVGFEASELRKLVDMVRRGGGSRYMSFSEKLTHVVVGNPSEM